MTLTPADKNPVQLLNELRPGLKYDLEEESGEPHAKKFSMSVVVDGEKFDGVGKLAGGGPRPACGEKWSCVAMEAVRSESVGVRYFDDVACVLFPFSLGCITCRLILCRCTYSASPFLLLLLA